MRCGPCCCFCPVALVSPRTRNLTEVPAASRSSAGRRAQAYLRERHGFGTRYPRRKGLLEEAGGRGGRRGRIQADDAALRRGGGLARAGDRHRPGTVRASTSSTRTQHKYKFLERKDKAKDSMLEPQCVAVDASDNIYVTDSKAGKIFVFEPSGKYKGVFGSLKGGEGFFKRPTGIAIDQRNPRDLRDRHAARQGLRPRRAWARC